MKARFQAVRLAVIVGALAVAGISPRHAFAQAPRPDELRSLRQRIDELLRKELTERWYPHAVDAKHGGFHENFARDWAEMPDENRFLVYQARLTWTAAAFAEYSPAHREEYLKYVRHGVEFLDLGMRDATQGGFHWVVDLEGGLRFGDEKHVYGTSFALYAASKAYAVTRDERALKVARDAFDWLEQHAHDGRNGGYFEALTRDGKPIISRDDSAPLGRRFDRLGTMYGFKSMNSHIHLLEALAEFNRVDDRPIVRLRLEEVLAIVRDRIAVDPGALNLYLTPDWRATPAHDSFGHDIETAYLLVEAAAVLKRPDDARTWSVARRLVDHALEWGWDNEHGGFYDKGEAFGGEAFDKTKVWWTEAEGLNALLVMHHKFGGETDRYWNAFRKQWNFIERFLIDHVHGGWFMETTREGSLRGDGRKATQWKGNYHASRALMNVATLLDEMLRHGDRQAYQIDVEAGAHDRRNTPVSVALPEPLRAVRAIRMERCDTRQAVEAQILPGDPPSVVWIVRDLPAGKAARYTLETAVTTEGSPAVTCVESGQSIRLSVGDRLVLGYNAGVVESPPGLDPLYRRSGHIHPLRTPSGLAVTDDFAPDHAHQHGVFFAWVNTTYAGQRVDFWNQMERTGRVAHVKTLSTLSGPVFGQFTARLSHEALKPLARVLDEEWVVRAYNVADRFLVDFESTQRCAGDAALEINAYHYGGFAFRGNRAWFDGAAKGNDPPDPARSGQSDFLTSEGKHRSDGNHTRPRWVDLSGNVRGKSGGVAILDHPGNFRFPQPVRLHPNKPYFCFSPMVVGAFRIEPGKSYVSRYRLVVHDGRADANALEQAWRDYSDPPRVRIAPAR
jgi:mannobiose 2-epimerase